ncbi:MAG: glutamate mutase L [Anaerolineales bacterium]|jgi:hypothetical protein|nr:glutamate mutase L [Anaerolineales bacterium]
MPVSLVEGNSLLAIDIGSVTTRAAYFDVVEGQYRFIGMGSSPTTLAAPDSNVAVGMQAAIESLQFMIDKPLLDENGHLAIPSQPDGIGVDSLCATISAGEALKAVLIGLLPDVSLKSIEKIAQGAGIQIVESFNTNDSRNINEQLDAIFKSSPDLVLIAGGTDGGATYSIQKFLELVGLASYLLPESRRPALLFAGNKDLKKQVIASMKNLASGVAIAPNVRPVADVEDLAPAQRQLASLIVSLRQREMPELADLSALCGSPVLPVAYNQGRMIRFLSSYFDTGRGVLSVNLGAASLSFGMAFGDDLHLNVFNQYGLGTPLARLLAHTTLEDLARWFPLDLPPETLRDYIYQKSLYPAFIPSTPEELAIEQTLVRHLLQLAARDSVARLPAQYRSRTGLLPAMQPILASGAALTEAATLGQKLLMLLDGLQPAGITTLAMDQNNLLGMLGAIAEQNSLLPVQVINSGALAYLATVIAPVVNNVNYGTPIVRAKLIRNDGSESETEVKMGALQILQLESGQTARLQLRPLLRADVGLGPGKAGEIDVIGSSLGIVIDARGRPIRLPAEPERRRQLLSLWQNRMGG